MGGTSRPLGYHRNDWRGFRLLSGGDRSAHSSGESESSSATPPQSTPILSSTAPVSAPAAASPVAESDSAPSFENHRCQLTFGANATLVYRPAVEHRVGSEESSEVPAIAGGGLPFNLSDGTQVPLDVEGAFECKSRNEDWHFLINGGVGNSWVQTMQTGLRPSSTRRAGFEELWGFSDLYLEWRPQVSENVRLNFRAGRRGDYGYQVMSPRLNFSPFYSPIFMGSPFTRTSVEAGIEVKDVLQMGIGVSPGLDRLPFLHDNNSAPFWIFYSAFTPTNRWTINFDLQGGYDQDNDETHPRIHGGLGATYKNDQWLVGVYGLLGSESFLAVSGQDEWRTWYGVNAYLNYQPEDLPFRVWADGGFFRDSGQTGTARTTTFCVTARGLAPNDDVGFGNMSLGINFLPHSTTEIRLAAQWEHCFTRTCGFPSGSDLMTGAIQVLFHTDGWIGRD
ncbi:MAG: outer membrane beta-barrel protein [Deltaproteobacteria bacterium]|nr:MAG: outer membrane beta-barrel protein [Deltaproteobacteria bacterium]